MNCHILALGSAEPLGPRDCSLQKGTIRETLAYALIAGGPVAVGPFAALWLRGHGVGFGYVGLCIAAPLLLRVVVYRPVASWSARFASDWTAVSLMCGVVASASLACVLSKEAGAMLVAWCALCLAANICTPLMDHAILKNGSPDDRGGHLIQAKGAGAIVYLLSVPVLGYGLRWGGLLSLPLWSGVIACIAAFSAACLAIRKTADVGAHAPQAVIDGRSAGGKPDLYGFAMMLLAAILIEASHGVQPLAMVHWTQRGISSEISGLLWATGTLADVALLCLARGWLRTIAPSAMLLLGGAAALLRWIGFALEPSLPELFLLQALHALSFTATLLATVGLAHCFDKGGARGQLLTWAASTGMAGGIAVLVASPLYGTFGVRAYWIMASLAGAGLTVAFLLHSHLRGDGRFPTPYLQTSFEKRSSFPK